MSDDQNAPDFDNMSPEELMAWMETLAERQGATEGFTTEKRVDIAEVDPDTVEDTGPGYIPYGMSEEVWAEKQAKEEAEKQARLAERAQQQAQPATPPPSAPAEPEPAAPAASAGGEPDFDNMSPEELMAWMETLAERQGATEGFTTEKRVDIAEVDPDTVEDTGPGYIPYGMSEEVWAEKQAKEEAEKQARLAERAQQQAQPAIPAPEPEETVDLPDFGVEDEAIEPPASLSDFELPGLDEIGLGDSTAITDAQPAAASADEGTGGLDWLENLAAEQSVDFGEMDLSGLGDELANMDLGGLEEDLGSDAADPMSWLEDMAAEQGVGTSPELQQPAADAASAEDDDVDPIEWLESLAATSDNPPSSDEFMTEASLNIDTPSDMDETQAPGYEDFEFESPSMNDSVELPDIDSLDVVDSTDPDDPVAWLDSLAQSQGTSADEAGPIVEDDEDVDDTEILSKLNQGISDPSEMENWMSALLEKGAARDDVPDYIEEEEEESAIEASIPDWLVEQVGTPPDFLSDEDEADTPEEAVAQAAPPADDDVELPAGLENLGDPVDEADIPAWLQEDVVEDMGGDENIFAEAAETTLDDLTSDSAEIDTSDPWVEAFEEERTQEGMPDWYVEKLAETTGEGQPVLEEAEFAEETELPHGQPEPVPDWMTADSTPAAAFLDDAVTADDGGEAVPADTSWLTDLTDDTSELSDEDIPEWLKEQVTGEQEAVVEPEATSSAPNWLDDADIDKVDTIPDWLLETISEGDEPDAISSADVVEAPTPQPVAQQATPPPPAPAKPAPPPAADIQEALESARGKLQNNDLEGALADYESVVRANSGLEHVVNDLSEAIKKPPYKNAAGVYRVLGDGLMRIGRLQDALDTYRKALNLL